MARNEKGKSNVSQAQTAKQVDAFDVSYSILKGEKISLNFEEIYRTVYRMVLQKQGQSLYESVSKALTKWLEGHVQPEILPLAQRYNLGQRQKDANYPVENGLRRLGDELLINFSRHCREYLNKVAAVQDCFQYLDRVYVSKNKLQSISAMSIVAFNDRILQVCLNDDPSSQVTVHKILHQTILQQLFLDRMGDIIDKKVVKSCIEMLYATSAEDFSGTEGPQSFGSAYLNWILEIRSKEMALEQNHGTEHSGLQQSLLREDLKQCEALMPPEVFKWIKASIH